MELEKEQYKKECVTQHAKHMYQWYRRVKLNMNGSRTACTKGMRPVCLHGGRRNPCATQSVCNESSMPIK
eukprot:3264183-Amphidinium_carterae.1